MKSHFKFTNGQRNGIFLLLISIVLLQCLYFLVDFPNEDISINNIELEHFQKEMDSLRVVAIEKRKPKIYPFNPNYITDYKGYVLGMTNEEIDRLLNFREQNKWINSTKQFQEVTKVSDSLLSKISPYFKFPDWVLNQRKKSTNSSIKHKAFLSFDQKLDLNTATAKQLQRINGIGEKLSKRIVAFRNKFVGGFIADVQLSDVYGLSPDVIERLTNQFTVKTPRQVKKINLNTATIEQLVTIQHIDYDVAHNIVEQRTLRDGYKSLEELKKVNNFPVNKIEIIKLYLTLD